ncbi:glycosyltransferase [Nonlabens xiamenensis]|uniref:glycosyltransferase n=1 Tax=Nonlabens xiamenensis TaxID=2341043 RepID=UPI000F60A217|nr:glycosyltransferase [Nonlabens xiamenensis]
MTWLYTIVIIGYAMLILLLVKEALSYQRNKINLLSSPVYGFSVVVNYRNESKNLPHLLTCLQQLDYPSHLWELILVNDGSDDGSAELIDSFKQKTKLNMLSLTRLQESASAKKDGIQQAVDHAQFEHIICTDADAHIPSTWLQAFDTFFRQHPKAHFVAGPVWLEPNGSLVSRLQSNEMIALQMMTIGAFAHRQPFLCNGANMAFTREAFTAVDGYNGNRQVSSGDDVFLLEKLSAEDLDKCHYLKDRHAIISTSTKSSWIGMIKQRARWAQKSGHTKSRLGKLISLQVLAMNLLIIASPVLYFLNWMSLEFLVATWTTKFFVDALSLVIGQQFFEDRGWQRGFVVCFLIYPIAVAQIALWSLRKHQWHGRSVSLGRQAEG